VIPKMDTAEPIRAKLRRERFEPTEAMSRIDTAEPSRAKLRSDIEEPSWM